MYKAYHIKHKQSWFRIQNWRRKELLSCRRKDAVPKRGETVTNLQNTQFYLDLPCAPFLPDPRRHRHSTTLRSLFAWYGEYLFTSCVYSVMVWKN